MHKNKSRSKKVRNADFGTTYAKISKPKEKSDKKHLDNKNQDDIKHKTKKHKIKKHTLSSTRKNKSTKKDVQKVKKKNAIKKHTIKHAKHTTKHVKRAYDLVNIVTLFFIILFSFLVIIHILNAKFLESALFVFMVISLLPQTSSFLKNRFNINSPVLIQLLIVIILLSFYVGITNKTNPIRENSILNKTIDKIIDSNSVNNNSINTIKNIDDINKPASTSPINKSANDNTLNQHIYPKDIQQKEPKVIFE